MVSAEFATQGGYVLGIASVLMILLFSLRNARKQREYAEERSK